MKTKTVLFGFAALFVLLAFTVAPVAAVKPVGNNGNSLKLVEKDPLDVSKNGAWGIVEDGAWGQFAGKSLNFKAYNLNSETDYTLISYAEPWGSPNTILASGTSDDEGNLEIKGGSSFAASNLICNEYPTATSDEYSGYGAKIWLILSEDINETGHMIDWNPTEYLFETALVDCEPAMEHICDIS